MVMGSTTRVLYRYLVSTSMVLYWYFQPNFNSDTIIGTNISVDVFRYILYMYMCSVCTCMAGVNHACHILCPFDDVSIDMLPTAFV